MRFFKILRLFSALFIIIGVNSCGIYKGVVSQYLDGEKLAFHTSNKAAKTYSAAKSATQGVFLKADHDYFRTSEHVRWKNGYMLSIDTLAFIQCPKPFDKVELGYLGIGWKPDSICAVEVNARDLEGKEVEMKAYCDSEVILNSMISFPSRFVLDFGDSVVLGDTIFWNGSSNKKDRVLIELESDSSRKVELIVRDNGQFVFKKRIVKRIADTQFLKISIYRTSAQRFEVGDSLNRSLGVFYLEKATTSVDWKKEKPRK